MTNLLARYAECLFWMARYMERAENLARILEVHEVFSRSGGSQGKNWYPVVQLNGDIKRFFARYPTPSTENVLNFYILDAQNESSIIFTVRAARENARTMRPWISTEMWQQLNVFYNQLLTWTPETIALPNLSRACGQIKEACQAHTGITEGTFYRDEGWFFYLLGKAIERADQTTRLLDLEFNNLLPGQYDVEDPLDFMVWHAVLRSVAGYHAFRRVNPRGMTPGSVAGFMIFNESFPRSVVVSARQINDLLTRLKARYKLRGGALALERVDEILAALEARTIDAILHSGLHQFLDWVQLRLIELTVEISKDFFGQAEEPAA